MNAANYIGIAMVTAPFVAVFVGAAMTIGIRGALATFGITAAIIALFAVGIALIGSPP